ncbi:MAG: prepilin-type N-terminal cleavage/methylation domain-containing protein [Gemmatimonadota bacterium]
MSAARRIRMSRRGRRQDGFTLVETMIAIVVLTFVVIGTGGVLSELVRIDRGSRTRTESAFFMQQILEDARSVPYAHLTSGRRTKDIGGGVTLEATWTVTEVVLGKLKQMDFRLRRVPPGPSSSTEVALKLFYANRSP